MADKPDPIRARAAAAIAGVERSLARPRPAGPIHGDPEPVDDYTRWAAQRAAEHAEREQIAALKRTSERALPKGSLAYMTTDDLAKAMGQALGEVRAEMLAEMLAEQETLTAMLAQLERRVAAIEGGHDGPDRS